jgi:hypothetical protein
LTADPLELRNLIGQAPERAAALRQALLAYFQGAALRGAPRTADEDALREHEKELRALGYID